MPLARRLAYHTPLRRPPLLPVGIPLDHHLAGAGHVGRDLAGQFFDRVEPDFVPKPLPELDGEWHS